MTEYVYKKARLKGTIRKLISEYPSRGYRLTSVTMSDLATRFELVFAKDGSDGKRYVYAHERCRLGYKVNRFLNEYSAKGYRLAFHVMADLMTRHELFFEKEVVD